MGRQHTTWISDETWERLQNIAGDSVSKKISNAVKFADPDQQMIHNSKMRQLAAAKSYLRQIAKVVDKRGMMMNDDLDKIIDNAASIMWAADMEMKE